MRNVTEASDHVMRTLDPSSSAVDKGNQFRAFFYISNIAALEEEDIAICNAS